MLENKTAIVTGGAQGLGQAICQRLAREGCRVLVGDMNEEGANQTARALNGQGIGFKVDVTQETQVQSLFEQALEKFGRIDVVVANAAILIAESITEADAEKWRAVMNVNLFGNFLTISLPAVP